MSVHKLNPQHPAAKAMEEQWPKIAMMLMVKYGIKEFEITEELFDAMKNLFPGELPTAVLDNRQRKTVVRLMSLSEAKKLMEAESRGN